MKTTLKLQPKSNIWGSSALIADLPQSAAGSQGTGREVVRLKLEQSQPITLYLGNPDAARVAGGMGEGDFFAHITTGAGGTSVSQTWQIPPQGVALPLSGDSLLVRIYRSHTPSVSGPRVSAYAALGKPAPFALTHQTFGAAPGIEWAYAIRPWVRAIRVLVLEPGANLSEVQVAWVDNAVDGQVTPPESTAHDTTAANAQQPLLVRPGYNTVMIKNTGAATLSVQLEQYGEM
jgi:hypothetical protein